MALFYVARALQVAEKLPTPLVILSGAKNLSFFSWAQN